MAETTYEQEVVPKTTLSLVIGSEFVYGLNSTTRAQ
jgi:hypothetical protein